jgi:NADPH-dependent glutamate synthase beta subunit-like oxidoreductase/formate hydrogenlyase subunit 6/NADH:ubiquinone oxidoreductase subunit I
MSKKEELRNAPATEIRGTLVCENGTSLFIRTTALSPCTGECPLGANVKGYVSLIAAGQFAEALDVVRQTNPFPGICGRVCHHPCEEVCTRKSADQPVAIAALKRFLADYELQQGIIPRYTTSNKAPGRVAVIGAGPAGLSCAADCARNGHSVTVFEALPAPGGMLAVGIPPYRLPRDILSLEIKAIQTLGVEIRLNTRIGETISLDTIRKEYDAVCIATGAHQSLQLGLAGENSIHHGIISWLDLLRESALSNPPTLSGHVVVVGGGNTAIDAARVALRCGAAKVTILYRRSRSEMPALAEEVEDACDEGIDLQLLCAPTGFLHDDGRLTAVTCIRMELGPLDAGGRPQPIPVKGSDFVIQCDALIPAVGQQVDTSFLSTLSTDIVTAKRLIKTDPKTLATSLPGVFAVGDAVLGAASVIEAIATGHAAARSIHNYLCGNSLNEHLSIAAVPELSLVPQTPEKKQRIEYQRLDHEKRRRSFEEIHTSYTESEAIAEAQRCLRCGPCAECVSCVGVCGNNQLLIVPVTAIDTPQLPAPWHLLRVTAPVHETVMNQPLTTLTLDNKEYNALAFTAIINEEYCYGCGRCEQVCGYHAIRVAYRSNAVFTAIIDPAKCRGCGRCVSVCPSGALDQLFFTHEKIRNTIADLLRRKPGGTIIFRCYWHNEPEQPSDNLPSDAITLLCKSRLCVREILSAFEYGAQSVLVQGCDTTTCHYRPRGTCIADDFSQLDTLLPLCGIDPKRFRILDSTKGDIGL